MSAGTTDHFKTNASPCASSPTNAKTLAAMINAVTAGKCVGRRDASDKGTTVPNSSSPRLFFYSVGADRIQATLETMRRAARDNDKRAVPLNSMLIPTKVPITHSVLDGQLDRKSTRLNSSHLGISY